MFFSYNGTIRSTLIKDKEALKNIILHPKATAGQLGSLGAPMPGEVVKMNVEVGKSVSKGDTVAVLSAMKMETNVAAPCSGVITSISSFLGQMLTKDDLIIEIREE